MIRKIIITITTVIIIIIFNTSLSVRVIFIT